MQSNDLPGRYDLARMQRALAGPFYQLPPGLKTAEEIGTYLDQKAKELTNEQGLNQGRRA